ncbi:hypothetical protein [Actinocrispum sp. NPDC049592]|uniref:hypothetical protein n=1 Tax=Actinocrispum sp. NPDC049592 TaxID=3154835 RepID=UPI0034348129
MKMKIAALAAGLLTAFAVASPASAATSVPDDTVAAVSKQPGNIEQASDGWCHFHNWGGTFFCKGTGIDAVVWVKPDHYPQVFVIGTNWHMYSRWSTASSVSGWQDMKGACNPSYGLPARSSGWNITIACVGTDGNWWHTSRGNGNWSPWTRGGL